MKSKMFLAVFLFVSIFCCSSIYACPDDPCEDAKKTTQDFVTFLNNFSPQSKKWTPELPLNGKFKVVAHKRGANAYKPVDGREEWYEVSYVFEGKIVSEGIISQIPIGGENVEVSVIEGGSKLRLLFLYGAGGAINCSYIIVPTSDGFSIVDKNK